MGANEHTALLVAAGTTAIAVDSAFAGVISVERRFRAPPECPFGAGCVYSRTLQYFVTTDSDILSIDEVVIAPLTGPLYQNAFGSDAEPGNPILIAAFPALEIDSYITTPAPDTAIAGGGFSAPHSAWFDTTDDGPVTNFLFAQLTTSGVAGFSGRINTVGPGGATVDSFAFHFPIPEPRALVLAAIAVLGALVRHRRLAAPPA